MLSRKTFATIPAPLEPGEKSAGLEWPRCAAFQSPRLKYSSWRTKSKKKIAIKLKLSEKYERLSYLAGSKVKQSTYRWHAKHFRNQAHAMQCALDFKKKSAAAS